MQDQGISERYEILQRLGNQKRRKFSEVYLIRSKSTGKQAVLKIVTDPSGIPFLKAEATFSFTSEQLPQVLEYSEEENSAYLILDYKSGVTWKAYLETVPRKAKFDVLCRLLEQLKTVLETLQEKTIAHLDIKPENLLYDAENDRIALIDFGLAIDYSQPISRKLVFPLGYAAPEVLLNRLHLVDQRSDYFSIAVCIVQLMDGKLPLLHANPSITTNLQLTHPLPDCNALNKAANKAVQQLGAKYAFPTAPNLLRPQEMDKGLEHGIAQRYSTFSDFLNDFKNGGLRAWWAI